jgi:glycosyltransferase involved in cell wall biosynthesis
VTETVNASRLKVKQTKPIVVVTLHRPQSSGGIQKHVEMLLGSARDLQLDIRVLSPFTASRIVTGVAFAPNKLFEKLHSPLHAWWYERSRAFVLKRVLQGYLKPPAIIYAQDPISAEAAVNLKKAGHDLEVVYAIHYNLSVAEEWVGKGTIARDGGLYQAMQARDGRILTQVDRLVFVSDFMAQQVLSQHPEAANVPRWVVPNVVSEPNSDTTSISSDLINIGTLEPRKNQAFLLEVLRHAHRLGHPYSLTLAGDGKDMAALKALAENYALTPFVTFAGNVPSAASLLPKHRVYVHAAQMESFGIVLVEALAAGLPVFAAPVGGVPEVFKDGVEGHYWPLDNPEKAAKCLISVLSDDERYEAMAKAAKERYQKNFTPAIIREKLVPIILGKG